MNAMRSWSFGDSLSAWLPNNRIVGLLKLKCERFLTLPYFPLIYRVAYSHWSEVVWILWTGNREL